MPRKPLIWFPGATYHIISKGIRSSSIFEDDEDRYKYLSLLAETKEKYNFTLQAYCLMTNHTHLQLQTANDPPGKIMHALNLKYAKYFNQKYSYSGHAFDNRYFWELVDSLGYEIELSKYIHLNPLKAGIVNKPEDYPWSSYRAYILQEKDNLISSDRILSYFTEPQISNYIQFIQSEESPLAYANLNIIGNAPV